MISMVREIGETKNNARNVATVYHDEKFKIFKMTNRCSLEEVLKDFFKRVVKSGSILKLIYDTEYNMLGVTNGSQHLKPGSSKMLVIEAGGLDDGFPEVRYFEETEDGYVPRDEFLAEVLKYIVTGEEGWDYIFKDGEVVTEQFVLDKVSNKVELREPLKFMKYSGCVEDIEKLLSSFNARVGEDEEGYTYKLIHLDGDAKLITHEDCGFEFILNNYILYTDEGLVCILSEEEFNKLFKRVL